MRQLLEHGLVERAALGVQVRAADRNDATWAGMDTVHGVVIASRPQPGSAAAVVGLRAGDLIVAVDGEQVDYVAQLQERIGFRRPGDAVTLDVRRKGGERTTVHVRLTKLASETSEPRGNARGSEDSPEGEPVAHLGVTVAPLADARNANRFRIPVGIDGLVVTAVEPGSDAESHLVPPSDHAVDIIETIDGQAVRDTAEVKTLLRGLTAGSVVSLEVYNTDTGSLRLERVRLTGATAR
jgi:serine protease Do